MSNKKDKSNSETSRSQYAKKQARKAWAQYAKKQARKAWDRGNEKAAAYWNNIQMHEECHEAQQDDD